MNVEAYNLDSLRKLIRDLQKENKELKRLLDEASVPYGDESVFKNPPTNAEEYDLDQASRIEELVVNERNAQLFFSMFWGRQDVFAKRAKSGQYYPQCIERWNDFICPKQRGERVFCEDCKHKNWQKLSPEIIMRHLRGSRKDGTDVIGVYPLFPDGTCRFLVFDFDNHEKDAEKEDFANTDDAWHDEVNALRLICKQNGIDALVERSRSGRGAHVWILFSKPISAAVARDFGFMLLGKGAASINLKSFKYYDRMYPSQNVANTIGNLIALPLQGRAIKNGNSVFVDENWNAYRNQWEKLKSTKKLSEEEIEEYIGNWQKELFGRAGESDYLSEKNRLKPWNQQPKFNKVDVTGGMHIVLADGVYVDTLNLKPRLQNQIRCLAAFDNPIFHKNKRLGYSNYYNFSMVYLGEDAEGYIKVPRGLLEKIISECKKSEILYEIDDQREKGRPIRVQFQGELRLQQNLAAQQLLNFDHGILRAATAFGKTVVCSYLIAQKKVNTLILLESTDLIHQWEEELNRFLTIDEEPPSYTTKTGRVKKRASVIGTLKGGKDTLTGIIDIAMVGSLYKKGDFHEKMNSYGMVIMDECHHAASATSQEILKKVNAKFVYGVSATPMRTDKLEKINFMLLGPIRHQYTALDRATEQGIDHLVIPRYTRVLSTSDRRDDINEAYRLVSESPIRNNQILEDLKAAVNAGRTPVVLTKYKEHAKYIYENINGEADHTFLLYGDNTPKENEAIIVKMKAVPDNESLILIATGQKIGEGFDFPRLDTLLLVSPLSSPGLLEQYVGRLNRDYQGKREVMVHDYIDSHIRVFNNMFLKRIKTYKKIGFNVVSESTAEKQNVKAIYDSGDYMEIFERDIVEAESEIIVSSPRILQEKVRRFISIVKPRQEAGVRVTVITEKPENVHHENTAYLYGLIKQLREAGIIVKFIEGGLECFAVMDKSLVWHGGMNLLGKEDAWDNLIRVHDMKVAAELLALIFQEG